MSIESGPVAFKPRSFRERFEEALRQVRAEMAAETFRPDRTDVPLAPRFANSAWAECVAAGAVRDRLRAAGLDATVRAVARELGSSRGRVGDLLKIRDAFPQEAIDWIGLMRDTDSEVLSHFSERGTRRLSLLSFRALRLAARLPYRDRLVKARQLARASEGNRTDPTVTGTPTALLAARSG